MEKSLVIVCRDAGVVTALAFAVTNLLTPFSWQGVFVPLLPNNVKEFFDAPVPFILGSTVPPRSGEISSQAAVLMVQEVSLATSMDTSSGKTIFSSRKLRVTETASEVLRSEAVSNGTIGFSGWFTRLPEVNADLPIESSLTETVNRACKYFQFEQIYRRRSVDFSTLPRTHGPPTRTPPREQQINILLMTSMTSSETRLVRAVIERVCTHNLRFTGDLLDPSAWPRYVRTNAVTETEEFLPELFMEPIKRVLEFHEAVVQTQLFVGLVDRIRMEHKSLDPFRSFSLPKLYTSLINFKLFLNLR
jgi:hypothetical protein